MCAIKLNLIKWNTKGKRQPMGNGFFENINTVKTTKKNSYRHFSLMFEIISKMSDREQKKQITPAETLPLSYVVPIKTI